MLIKKPIVVFAAVFVAAAFFLQTATSKSSVSAKSAIIKLPAGVKWGQRPKVIKMVCPDLQSWEAKGRILE